MQECGRRRHLDNAARSGERETLAFWLGYCAGETFQEFHVMERGSRDSNNAGNTGNGIGMFLEGRIPEILRIMLLAGGEVDVRRKAVFGKSERETEFHRRAVRFFAHALEFHHSGRIDLRGAERGCISFGVMRFQKKHRQAFMPFGEIAVEGCE